MAAQARPKAATCLVVPATGGYLVGWRCPDSDDFAALVRSFKHKFMWRGVEYRGPHEGWYVSKEDAFALRRWIGQHFNPAAVEWVEEDDDDQGPHHQAPRVSAHGAARAEAARKMYLLPDAPDYVVVAVFRALALRLHPDQGGNDQTMIALTAARDLLLKKPP